MCYEVVWHTAQQDELFGFLSHSFRSFPSIPTLRPVDDKYVQSNDFSDKDVGGVSANQHLLPAVIPIYLLEISACIHYYYTYT